MDEIESLKPWPLPDKPNYDVLNDWVSISFYFPLPFHYIYFSPLLRNTMVPIHLVADDFCRR